MFDAQKEVLRPDQRPRISLALDLLAQPLADSPGLSRDDAGFIVREPWALANYGAVTLRRGWWMFECEGHGDVSGLELRLLSPEDTLHAFSNRRAAQARLMLATDRTFDVSVMASPWPGRIDLSVLRLRRMTRGDEARMAAEMASRLIRSGRPLSRLAHVATRVISGRSLRIHTPAAQAGETRRDRAPASPDAGFTTEIRNGVTAVLRRDETLDARATEIVAAAFEREPGLRAIYADVEEGGSVRPRSGWDKDLAAHAALDLTPVFFRGETPAADPWSRLRALSDAGSPVARVALPLARRDQILVRTFDPPPTPVLTRTPSVSVIIPSSTRTDLLAGCLSALAGQTGYGPLDIVVVDNGADPVRMNRILADNADRLRIAKVDAPGPFNFSLLVNSGVRASSGEVVLLLNDDVEAIGPGWLHRMVESAMAPGVGCVGARLLYPDRTIQHAGVTLGVSGICGHQWKGLTEADAATIPQVVLPSGRMAVTGACLAIRRDLFDRVGGLDETAFPVAYNDIDFCLRVRAAGHRTIYRGDAVLIHHESQSRGSDDATMATRKRLARETATFLDRWRHLLNDDPFGSPAFDLTVETGAAHPSLLVGQAKRE